MTRPADEATDDVSPRAASLPHMAPRRIPTAIVRGALYLSPIGAAIGMAGFSGTARSGNVFTEIGFAVLGAVGGAIMGGLIGLVVVILRRFGRRGTGTAAT